MNISRITAADLSQAATVHKEAFPRQMLSYEWIECNVKAFPRMLTYVAKINDVVAGYIIWSQKSGFRLEVVIELEQLAVLPSQQGNGVGTALIRESLPSVQKQLSLRGSTLKHIIVTTRADNYAQTLYKKVLKAKVEMTISNLYSADEVVMIARNV